MSEENGAPFVSEKSTPGVPEFHEIRSKYEFVIAAAREAERLNDYYRNHGVHPDRKVTTEAIDRIKQGLSRVIYEEPKPAEEESRKESTYFFGP
jgi:DNA-directed RNA polymerase subunit K/omega